MGKVRIILRLLLGAVLLWAAGYFLFGYIRLADEQLPQDYFAGKAYETPGGEVVLRFIGADEAQLASPNGQLDVKIVEYQSGIFRLSGAAGDYYFIVVDADSLYSNTLQRYFYRVGDSNESG